jgi:hypothetical protein
MAFDLVPPPPPTAPLSYSPPSEEVEVNLDLNVFEPIKESLATALRYITLHKNPSTSYYVAANLHDTLFNEKMAPLWELFPSQPSTPDIILAQLQAIRAELSGISPTQDPHPVVALDHGPCSCIQEFLYFFTNLLFSSIHLFYHFRATRFTTFIISAGPSRTRSLRYS